MKKPMNKYQIMLNGLVDIVEGMARILSLGSWQPNFYLKKGNENAS